METLPKLSVVIPTFNRKGSVLELLQDLTLQEGVAFETIVVDDASPDDTVQAIKETHPSVTILKNDNNSGPCVARNRGIIQAKTNIIVGLDSDVRINDKSLLSRIYKIFQSLPQNVGILAFRLLQPDGKSDDKARWWHPSPIQNSSTQEFQTNYFSGTGYALRKSVALQNGMFPEILYMHYEEVELAWRTIDSGYTIRYRPDLIVIHNENPVSRRSEIKSFYKTRNQILLAAGCLPIGPAVSFLIPRLIYNATAAIKNRAALAFAKSLVSAATLMPARLKSRKPVAPMVRDTKRYGPTPSARRSYRNHTKLNLY